MSHSVNDPSPAPTTPPPLSYLNPTVPGQSLAFKPLQRPINASSVNSGAMDWRSMSPQNSYAEALGKNVVIYGRCSLWGFILVLNEVIKVRSLWWNWYPCMMEHRHLLSPHMCTRSGHVSTQWDGGHPQAKRTGLRMKLPCWHLHLGLPTSRTIKNTVLLFMPPSLWYLTTEAQTD